MSAYTSLLDENGIKYLENEDTSRHVTMQAGGKAALFVMPETAEQLVCSVSAAKSSGERYYLLGNGSNTVFSDAGFDGAVISSARLSDISVSSAKITAGCGALLSKTAFTAAEAELTGMEFAHGIPGTVGGAVFMNAGAYGGEMKDIIESVTFFNGNTVTLAREKLYFGYRESVFSKDGGLILSVTLSLEKGNGDNIRAKMKELSEKRREKQPLNFPSAGSAFKRPEGFFAGKLIEDAGLKGFSVGGMAVSEKHAGFIVNTGGGTATDLEMLINEVVRRVSENSGITLEPEIRLVK